MLRRCAESAILWLVRASSSDCWATSNSRASFATSCRTVERSEAADDREEVVRVAGALLLLVQRVEHRGVLIEVLPERLGTGAESLRGPGAIGLSPEEAALAFGLSGLRRLVKNEKQVSVGDHGVLGTDSDAEAVAKGLGHFPAVREMGSRYHGMVLSLPGLSVRRLTASVARLQRILPKCAT